MKNYTITVNGTAYQVTVEEGFAGAAAPAAATSCQHRQQLQLRQQHRQQAA